MKGKFMEGKNKGKLVTIKGDVTSPQFTSPNEVAIIPHCCNNGVGNGIGVMGSGVALSLKNKWPEVYKVYKDMEKENVAGLTNRLGDNSSTCIDDNIIVVNMIGQNGIGRRNNTIPLKYVALMNCMIKIRTELISSFSYDRSQYFDKKPVIHSCKFGSELAGGNFNFILELIREIWLEEGLDVVVYNFKK